MGILLPRQFTAILLREMALLWQGRQTSGVQVLPGRKRRIELTGNDDGGWEHGGDIE